MTAEQLFARAGEGRSELIWGEMVKHMPVGRIHARLVTRLLGWIAAFVEKFNLGDVGPEWGVTLARNPDLVYAPDITFVSAPRLVAENAGFFEGGPDLAVEVLSPDERPGDIREKVKNYLEHGTQMVWVVDPRTATVTIHRAGTTPRSYSAQQEVSGEEILPGFSFRVDDLFASII